MTSIPLQREARVAVLVDCDNVSPDILDHALRMAAQFGRVVMHLLETRMEPNGHWTVALVPVSPEVPG